MLKLTMYVLVNRPVLNLKQVFSGCGKPGTKTKRSVSSNGDFFIESPKRRQKRTPKQSSQPTPAGVSLDK